MDGDERSRLTEEFRFHGRDQVRVLLEAAFTTVTGIHFHTGVSQDRTSALLYRGHTQELTLFIRSRPRPRPTRAPRQRPGWCS